MLLDRRTVVRSLICSCLAPVGEPPSLYSQSIPPGELDVIATVLRAQCRKGPILIATERFSTVQMTVQNKPPTAFERASHQVQLPYLTPPAEHMTEAEALAIAYNRSLDLPAPLIAGSTTFNFKYRLLDAQVVAQFEALYPGGNVYSEELDRKRRAVSSRYRLFFDGSMTVWRVSRVAFASNGALAVIGLRSSGGSCWLESWEVLERSQGAWHGLQWGGGLATCA